MTTHPPTLRLQKLASVDIQGIYSRLHGARVDTTVAPFITSEGSSGGQPPLKSTHAHSASQSTQPRAIVFASSSKTSLSTASDTTYSGATAPSGTSSSVPGDPPPYSAIPFIRTSNNPLSRQVHAPNTPQADTVNQTVLILCIALGSIALMCITFWVYHCKKQRKRRLHNEQLHSQLEEEGPIHMHSSEPHDQESTSLLSESMASTTLPNPRPNPPELTPNTADTPPESTHTSLSPQGDEDLAAPNTPLSSTSTVTALTTAPPPYSEIPTHLLNTLT
ncbi:hypothetical protein CVT24_010345 [Panaeolus cyanescens]|uniref:Uncharacterized protein n=1 Tax=Panaeolus cyanescens TaxID=181874 RepID=A0A409YQH4_9AGAR|nr:hypothetical protein CVT24_010345 [Panaeolus cyanescens]